MLGIHVEQANGSPPRRCQAHNLRSSDHEMVRPPVLARMEKSHNSVGLWVNTAEIRPFIQITTITSRQRLAGSSRVLLRNDMLDMERNLDRILWQSAVFATLTRSLSDQVASSRIHYD